MKVAIVGLGFMGRMHAAVYERIGNATVTAVCDSLPSAKQQSGNLGGSEAVNTADIPMYTDFYALLEEGGFDAVDICLPTDLHAEYVIAAMQAGYHVFCEKPIALTLSDAQRIIDTYRETDRVCVIGHCLRMWPAYSEVRKLIQSKKYGAVHHAEFSRYSPMPAWAVAGWLTNSKRSGNACLDMHIHDVDIIQHYFGMPHSLSSVGVPDGNGFFVHISTVYHYDTISVTSTGGWGFHAAFPFRMCATLLLDDVSVQLDSAAADMVMMYPKQGEAYALELPSEDGYFYELSHFTECVETNTKSSLLNPVEAMRSLHIVLTEIESARKKTLLTIEDIKGE